MIDSKKPPIRITPHDELRMQIAQTLVLTIAKCLTLPVDHDGAMLDMLDRATEIARTLDSFVYESVELREWAREHASTQEEAAKCLAGYIRSGDIDALARYSKQLVMDHPLPVVVVDPNVERAS